MKDFMELKRKYFILQRLRARLAKFWLDDMLKHSGDSEQAIHNASLDVMKLLNLPIKE